MLKPLIRWGIGAASLITLHAQPPMVSTWHNDNARTGQNLNEAMLTPANVNPTTFGRLATISVDGKVDAQPLYVPDIFIPGQGVRNILYVATEHNSVYAFDADTFVQLLHVSLNGSGETTSDSRSCGQITPEIGITATPAIDTKAGPHGAIYVIAMSKDANSVYHHRLHALDPTTLAEQFKGPVEIHASFPGNGAENTFLPAQHVERPGLLIMNGSVYTAWGSHCDQPPYAGWILSYNETTLAQNGVISLEPNGSDGAIWMAGAGPAADANGNIYLLTGNGTFDTTLNSSNFPAQGDFGNAFVKISTASGHMALNDYFTMTNTVAESGSDVDLGSAGLVLLPQLNDPRGQPVSLLAGAGKDGNIYIVKQSGMGKFNPSMDAIYQLMSHSLPSGTWSSPAWFNGTLYYGGQNDSLKAFQFTNGSFSLTSQSPRIFPYPGLTPSISANGTSGGIVWVVENASPAVLHAFDAANLSTELYNSNQAAANRDHFGNGNKFMVPTITNGKVYVGTQNTVGVFGLLAGSNGSLQVSSNASQAAVNLTAEGSLDWIAFGSTGSRKSGVSPQLSSYTVIGNAPTVPHVKDPRSLSWSDGTPTTSTTGTTTGVYVWGDPTVVNGFSFTAPADTTSRKLTVHVGGWNSAGTFTAHLSDGSAPDYTSTAAGSTSDYDVNYTLVYQAASKGQLVTLTWTLPPGTTGHVNVEAAALSN